MLDNFFLKRHTVRDTIYIKGARQNNLKDITLEIPRDKLVVFTGISGSGKSTLVFDTILPPSPLTRKQRAATRARPSAP